MTLKRLKAVCLEKWVSVHYIALIEIIILVVITQLYIPYSDYYLGSTGGSAGTIDYYPKNPEIVNNSSGKNNNSSENIDIPKFDTALKPMGRLNWTNHILYPEDASSYIMPENEVVKWYAENTILTDGALLWKHNRSAVEFKYESDIELFSNPLGCDMWQNPDYYLAHGSTGDCEDFSLAFASILEAKEISTQVVGVTLVNGQNHWLVKYYFNGRINYADINRKNVMIWHNSNPTIEEKWIIIDIDGIHPIS